MFELFQNKYSLKKRNFRTFFKQNLKIFFKFSQKRNSSTHYEKFFINSLKTGILARFIKKSKSVFYIYQKWFCFYLKAGISKVLLYLPKTEISKNSISYIFRKKYCEYFLNKKHQSLFIFEEVLFSILHNILSYTQLAFVFHTQEDFYIVCNHILAFVFFFRKI